jgi:CTP:phosphocholine cytidylyltransferase-like protein
MQTPSGRELYIKVANKYVPLGTIKVGRIKLKDGSIYELGSLEELFDLDLTDEDKALLGG